MADEWNARAVSLKEGMAKRLAMHRHYEEQEQIKYAKYMQSDAWAVKRTDALNRALHACQVCNSPDRLEVHHRTYDRLGDELPEDLTVLCDVCHDLFHKNGRLAK